MRTVGRVGVSKSREVDVDTLLDSGADISVIDPNLALELGLAYANVALPPAPRWGNGQAGLCYGAF